MMLFAMPEAGATVNNVPRFQVDPEQRCMTDHSMFFKPSKLRIHMKLSGIFSCFPACKPSNSELENVPTGWVEFIIPGSHEWNPNSEHCSGNEDAMMMTWDGNSVEASDEGASWQRGARVCKPIFYWFSVRLRD